MKALRPYLPVLLLALLTVSCGTKKTLPDSYMVVARESARTDSQWQKVVSALRQKHAATVVYFTDSPREALPEITRVNPRYVAFVDQPENIGRDYIMDLHRMSRTIDGDIFADYLWGVITGYDAAGALKMVDNSTEPLVARKAVVNIMEMNSGKWFDQFGFIDDHTPGLWGEKNRFGDPTSRDTVPVELFLAKFRELYGKYDPDLVVTAAHASEGRLEMPFSYASLIPVNGRLHTDFHYQRPGQPVREYRDFNGSRDTVPMLESGKRRVYFAVGNCLIGNVNNTNESMAVAWMNGSDAATMIGYVVNTWHGRNGWGGLKYWITNSGRYSLAEAIYMNQQDFLYQQSLWAPGVTDIEYPFDSTRNPHGILRGQLQEMGIEKVTNDHIGFIYDRDVLAYYGDPKWDVRLQEVPGETDYTVTSRIKGGKYIVTLKTHDDFSLERMVGGKFKQEHVLDIPFSYFFPERLVNPRMAEGQAWDAAVSENFLLVYNPQFEPGKTYEFVIDLN